MAEKTTAKTASERFERLLSHGYFAPELPPCFVSDRLAAKRNAIWKHIEAIKIPSKDGKNLNEQAGLQDLQFTDELVQLPRFGRTDRRHGVPNPIAYMAIAKILANHFVQLRSRTLKLSGLSTSPLVFDWTGTRAILRPTVDLLEDFRLDLSSRREEYVSADLRAFYHSVYTHSIPWAVRGKAEAKAKRHDDHYSNLLDQLSRNAQDGQTIGLPVGPDTSRILGEVVTSGVDAELAANAALGPRDASRYIVDYTVSSADGRSGAALAAALRRAAAVYEVELNQDKTAIVSTAAAPRRAGSRWLSRTVRGDRSMISQLQAVLLRAGPRARGTAGYQRGAVGAVERPDRVPWMRPGHVAGADPSPHQRLPPQEHACGPAGRTDRRPPRGEPGRRGSCRYRGLPRSAHTGPRPRNRTGELVWLLFLMIVLRIQLNSRCFEGLTFLEEPMCALLIRYARHEGLISGKLETAAWDAHMTVDGLDGPTWLYAYEPARLGFVSDDRSHVERQALAPSRHCSPASTGRSGRLAIFRCRAKSSTRAWSRRRSSAPSPRRRRSRDPEGLEGEAGEAASKGRRRALDPALRQGAPAGGRLPARRHRNSGLRLQEPRQHRPAARLYPQMGRARRQPPRRPDAAARAARPNEYRHHRLG